MNKYHALSPILNHSLAKKGSGNGSGPGFFSLFFFKQQFPLYIINRFPAQQTYLSREYKGKFQNAMDHTI